MQDQHVPQFPHVFGPNEDVLTEFGVSRQSFMARLREILLQDPPPKGLDRTDVAALLRVCRA
ncbi:hypothetical protein [Rhodococcus sp. 1168]|uniref:hypothetical protein n=1 Tax=Rhodococcus sp. 1168 TaxID=2018041 RepID=UPI000A0B8E92|nr:hypothetical protein [Rhodococcus sp. 1168]ORI18588.1 hypothetical protein BJI47_03710 [Rhodococcus sp. 1168]